MNPDELRRITLQSRLYSTTMCRNSLYDMIVDSLSKHREPKYVFEELNCSWHDAYAEVQVTHNQRHGQRLTQAHLQYIDHQLSELVETVYPLEVLQQRRGSDYSSKGNDYKTGVRYPHAQTLRKAGQITACSRPAWVAVRYFHLLTWSHLLQPR
jgi:hypothetical protein